MTTPWKLSANGLSAQRTLDDGSDESRMVESIPVDELAIALPADPVDQNIAILAQISALEHSSMIPRITREFMLGQFLITAQAAGYTEGQLYAVNVGYKKLKDHDAEIETLRARLV